MTIQEITSVPLHKHFVHGCFEKNYMLSVLEGLASRISSQINEDVFMGLAEDMLFDQTIACDEAAQGKWNTLTVMTVMGFLGGDFYEDGSAMAGMLHIIIQPYGFTVELDGVDFDVKEVLDKFPSGQVVKTYKGLFDLLNKFIQIRESMYPELQKQKEIHGRDYV